MSSSPLVNSLVKNRLFKTAPDIGEPPFQFIHTMDLSVVVTVLHDSPGLVLHRTEIWAVWRPQVGSRLDARKFGVFDVAVQLLHVRGAVCRCTTVEQRHCVSLAAVRRHYDVVKQHARNQ